MPCGSYTKFLALLMFNRVFNQQTLSVICGGNALASYYKNKALREKHIKETKIEKRERTKHIYVTYSLTRAGYLYLLNHDKDITYFFASEDCASLIPTKKSEYNSNRKIRLARDSEALALAEAAGCFIPHENFTVSFAETQDEDEPADEGMSVGDYIKGNLTEEIFDTLSLYNNQSADKESLVFHNSACIKSSAGNTNDYVTARDYFAGRYNGVADSRFKSVLLFTAPMFGIGWFKWIIEKEISAHSLWKKTRSKMDDEYLSRQGSSAALIVHSPRQFANLYFDVDKAKRDGNEEFGGGYRELYIIPLNENGAKQFHWLMLTDDDAFNEQTVEDAVASGAYVRNEGANKRLFPLLNEFSQRTALGFQMDAKKMLRIEHIAKSLPDETFEVICQPWQEEYYKKVMPENVSIKLIDLE